MDGLPVLVEIPLLVAGLPVLMAGLPVSLTYLY